MHDGAYQTLWDVVEPLQLRRRDRTTTRASKDPAIAPLMLTDAELGDLVEFLRALEDGPLSCRPTDFPAGLIATPPLPP